MLEKIKGLGAQAASKAGDAVDGITTSVKGGVDALANTATSVADTLNEKAVRASTAQMCTVLELALDEIKRRPISGRPVSLTATVNIGITSLEMQVQLAPAQGAETGYAVVPSDSQGSSA